MKSRNLMMLALGGSLAALGGCDLSQPIGHNSKSYQRSLQLNAEAERAQQEVVRAESTLADLIVAKTLDESVAGTRNVPGRVDKNQALLLRPGQMYAHNHPKLGRVFIFICNTVSDSNNNGSIDEDEFIGVKDTFGVNEGAVFYMGTDRGIKANDLDIRIFDSNGHDMRVGADFNPVETTYGVSKTFGPGELGQLGLGRYSVLFSYEGKPVGKMDFNVTK